VKLIRVIVPLVLIAGLGLPGRASAQNQTVTQTDIQRLDDALADATRDIAAARTRDGGLAAQLESELGDLRDETAYLRVKLRKNEPVARTEYFDLRDRIDDLRSRARGDRRPDLPPTSSGGVFGGADRGGLPPEPSTSPRSEYDVPPGTEFDVRLRQSLSSATNLVEDRFEATTLVDLMQNDRDDRDGRSAGRVIVPAGSVMRGVVSSVTKAGRLERTGRLTLMFEDITIDGRTYPIRATVAQALESEGIRGETGRIGAGAGIGAIIGGILGGFKGAMAGILVGAGGTVAATEGKDVELPAGTVLRVRLDSGLDLR
jgi:hypothetical protein